MRDVRRLNQQFGWVVYSTTRCTHGGTLRDDCVELIVAIVDAVLLVLAISNMNRRALVVTLWATLILLLAACGSEAVEQAQVGSMTPTSVPTTAPLSAPTSTPVPTPTSAALSQVTSTPLPAPTLAPTTLPTPTPDPTQSPTTAADAAPSSTVAPRATVAAEVIETPTPVPTPTAEEPETEEGASASDSVSTPVAETPTAVVAAAGEPPLECYDSEVQVYRAFVDGVDALSFDGGKVTCAGAGTNAVSAARSYRHSSGLVVHRNADNIFNDAGTGYIRYSGSVHFCINGQSASAPVRADTVPALLVVIDNEAQRQLAQGASGPAAFTGSSSQC